MMKFSGDNVLEIGGNISHIEPDSILIRKITNMENHKLDTIFSYTLEMSVTYGQKS